MDTRVRSLDAEPSSRRVSAAGRGPKDDDDGENQLFLADVIFGERIINELFAVRRCESQREGEKNGRRRCEPDRERERAKELVIDVYPSTPYIIINVFLLFSTLFSSHRTNDTRFPWFVPSSSRFFASLISPLSCRGPLPAGTFLLDFIWVL